MKRAGCANAALPNSLVCTPIEDWTGDDFFVYLMQLISPWRSGTLRKRRSKPSWSSG